MNWLKDKMTSAEIIRGLWLASGSPVIAELAGMAGFDWLLIDLEHGLGGEESALQMLQALSATSASAIVRVPAHDSTLIGRVLDFGAAGVMAPMINHATEAEDFVRRLKYPPEGRRGMTGSSRASGYGYDFKTYYREANAAVTGIVQIETAAGVAQADEIAAVPGVDILFVGHSDLSLELGCFEQYEAPAMREAEQRVVAACVRHGKRAGMLLKSGMRSIDCQPRGFTFLALGSDLGCLKGGMRHLLQ